jgi:hypothetical protein
MIRSSGPSAPKSLAFDVHAMVDIDVIQGSEAARGSKQTGGNNSHGGHYTTPEFGLDVMLRRKREAES